MKLRFTLSENVKKGGPGSGHHGHAGRPGKRGGSLPAGGGSGGGKSSEKYGAASMDSMSATQVKNRVAKELGVKMRKSSHGLVNAERYAMRGNRKKWTNDRLAKNLRKIGFEKYDHPNSGKNDTRLHMRNGRWIATMKTWNGGKSASLTLMDAGRDHPGIPMD